MEYTQYVSYAVFAAEQVLDIFEHKYPEDKRPRAAIEAAKKCIENPSEENRKTAYYAIFAGSYTSTTAAASASAAFYAATVSSSVVDAYAAKAARAASNAYFYTDKMLLKILNYGLNLLEANNG